MWTKRILMEKGDGTKDNQRDEMKLDNESSADSDYIFSTRPSPGAGFTLCLKWWLCFGPS